MLSRKGMTIPVLGTVLIVIAVVIAALGGFFGAKFEVEKMQSGGLAMSLQNHEEFWLKSLDQSVEIVAERAAFDLAKTGGIPGSTPAVWDADYPTMEVLRGELEKEINRTLPTGSINRDRIISLYGGQINITNYGNDYFIIDGEKHLSVEDASIEAKIILNPHEFNRRIESNYFKLLEAGRIIVEEGPSSPNIDSSLTVETFLVDGMTEYRISERNCVASGRYYCMAPTKPDEYGAVLGGVRVPYDYLKLVFRVA